MQPIRLATAPSSAGVVRRLAAIALAVATGAAGVLVAPVANVVPAAPVRAAASFADPYFREVPVFTGLTKPTSVRFASDGRAFVIEKAGVVKVFDSVDDTTPTTVVDISADVMNYWDRGLLGLAVDPGFLTGRPYLYLLYVWGAEPGDTTQDWGDGCPAAPSGPGGVLDGCVASTKIDRLQLNPTTNALVSRTNLLWDACQQYPSHSGGGMAFGTDGQLYVSLGDGASFNGVDYGQRGGTVPDYVNPITPLNPCLDPVTRTSPEGTEPVVDVPSAEGGQLRSQDVRTTSDPTGLDGAVIRINPDTGAASSGNPLASSSDANARRIIAHGLRNPYRLTFRPGTNDLYVGHVGNQTWESIYRVPVSSTAKTATTLPNAGWPCYEGPAPWGTFQALSTSMCASLYAQSGAVLSPLYTYSHASNKLPTGPCFNPGPNGTDGGSPTGLAFYTGATTGSTAYPAAYAGGLFWVDYDRDCLAFLPAGSGGVPDGSRMTQIATGIGNPVDLVAGPGGDLYYVDHDDGRVVRIRYTAAPVAVATATPSEAGAPVTVLLDGSGSTEPDPGEHLVAWRWDLDDDGAFDDASGVTYSWSITTQAVYRVGLEVESSSGLRNATHFTFDATNDPPDAVIDQPASSLTWAVGDSIPFKGHATDPQDGQVPGSRLAWDVVMLHCPADCHEHVIQSLTGTSGSFEAPDHPYPSHLLLRLTATDSGGSTDVAEVELQPRTKTVTVSSSPSGIPVVVGDSEKKTPYSVTVLENGSTSVTPPLIATVGGVRHRFWAWADGGPRVRDVQAPVDQALSATYYPDAADTCATATATPTGSWTRDRAGGSGDIDWFRFTLTTARRVILTLGDLPVNARLDLYGSCSTRLATSDESGTRFEELTRDLKAGTYRVRVTFANGASSASPYLLRMRLLPSGLIVKSWRATAGAGGGSVRIVGEVFNNTRATKGRATVTATFKSASGTVVKRLTGYGFSKRLGDGRVTPFVISGSVPRYASVSFAVSSGTVPRARSLSLTSLTRTVNANGTVTERGRVRNTGTTTVRSVAVARTWYGRHGEVLDRGSAYLSPSTLGPGASGTFSILRPALPGVQAARTALRGS